MSKIFFLIKKYLLLRKTSLSINIIASISVLGLAIGTASLIIVLSVFNGFEELSSSLFSKYNPDIKIVLANGKSFKEDTLVLSKIKEFPEIKFVSRIYEQSCMFQYDKVQEFGTLKGIDRTYVEMISLDSAIIEGELNDYRKTKNFAYIGSGIGNKLNVSIDNFFNNILAFTPGFNNGKMDFGESQNKRYSIQPRLIYSFQNESDYEVIMTDLDEFRKFIGDSTVLTSIQLKLHNIKLNPIVVNKLKNLLGKDFIVKDRYLQDEAFLKIMNLEKWLFFTLFLLTLMLVSLTMVGTLWMIVLEKRLDISILKSLGMKTSDIQKVYYGIGIGIGLVGMLLGFILALLFYYLQSKYSLIKVPEDFIIQSYPIALRLKDFFIVSLAVLTIVVAACILPTRKIKEVDVIFHED
ncbi:MAG: FtsX-like permease family protein [Saprospiraceae bacterium]